MKNRIVIAIIAGSLLTLAAPVIPAEAVQPQSQPKGQAKADHEV